MIFENTDHLFVWYDANENNNYSKNAVLDEVAYQYANNGMTKYESRFSDGHVATYSYSVICRYIIDGSVVCTVDEDGIHGEVPEDWDELEEIFVF